MLEHRLDISITNNDHPWAVLSLYNAKTFSLLEKRWQVISYSDNTFSIWGLPEREGENIVLLLHWADLGFPLFDEKNSYFTQNECRVSLLTCEKHESEVTLQSMFKKRSAAVSRLYDNSNMAYFLAGIQDLFSRHLDAPQETFKSATMRYIGTHINKRLEAGDHKSATSVMSEFCKMVCERVLSVESRNKCLALTKYMLESPDVSWTPQSSYTVGANPLGILLKKAQTQPLVMDVVMLMIGWCHDQAKEMSRPEYLLFVLQCMPELNQLHPELALKVSQHYTFLQVPERQIVIDNHAIVRFPSFSQLRSSLEPAIYECRNPILQFRVNPERPEPKNEYFTEIVFLAPFSLLWSIEKPPEDCSLDFFQTKLPSVPWWKVLQHLALHQFNLFSHVYVRPHYYGLDALNSPAIEALIQYKW